MCNTTFLTFNNKIRWNIKHVSNPMIKLKKENHKPKKLSLKMWWHRNSNIINRTKNIILYFKRYTLLHKNMILYQLIKTNIKIVRKFSFLFKNSFHNLSIEYSLLTQMHDQRQLKLDKKSWIISFHIIASRETIKKIHHRLCGCTIILHGFVIKFTQLYVQHFEDHDLIIKEQWSHMYTKQQSIIHAEYNIECIFLVQIIFLSLNFYFVVHLYFTETIITTKISIKTIKYLIFIVSSSTNSK